MDLEQFVSETICAVICGIKSAGDTLRQRNIGAAISPVWDASDNLSDDNVLRMDFDVAITVAESAQSEAGRGVKVGIQVLSLGGERKDHTLAETSSVSRVKFSVPYIPPSTMVLRPTMPTLTRSVGVV